MDELKAKLGFDVSEFVSGLDKALSALKQFKRDQPKVETESIIGRGARDVVNELAGGFIRMASAAALARSAVNSVKDGIDLIRRVGAGDKEATALGLSIDRSSIQQVKEMDNAMSGLSRTWNQLKVNAAEAIIPLATPVAKYLEEANRNPLAGGNEEKSWLARQASWTAMAVGTGYAMLWQGLKTGSTKDWTQMADDAERQWNRTNASRSQYDAMVARSVAERKERERIGWLEQAQGVGNAVGFGQGFMGGPRRWNDWMQQQMDSAWDSVFGQKSSGRGAGSALERGSLGEFSALRNWRESGMGGQRTQEELLRDLIREAVKNENTLESIEKNTRTMESFQTVTIG